MSQRGSFGIFWMGQFRKDDIKEKKICHNPQEKIAQKKILGKNFNSKIFEKKFSQAVP